MILCLISGTSFFSIVIKSIAGGIILGSIGFGIDYFFQRTLSQEDYNSLFKVSGSAIKESNDTELKQDHKFDVTENAEQNTEAIYQDLYKNNINNESADPESSKKANTESKISYNDYDISPEDNSIPDAVSKFESKPAGAINENISKLNTVSKEEKIKNENHLNSMVHDNKVTFKLKNKVINADPGIVAKAIKTILHKE